MGRSRHARELSPWMFVLENSVNGNFNGEEHVCSRQQLKLSVASGRTPGPLGVGHPCQGWGRKSAFVSWNDGAQRRLSAHRRRMGDFKKLQVWRKAHALVLNVHRVAAGMRGPGHAGLRNQMIRAALSVPTNIVEGHGQASKRDFARFLGYAINSTSELEYHLIAARDLGAIAHSDFVSLLAQLVEVRKMLHGLITSLRPAATLPRVEGSRDVRLATANLSCCRLQTCSSQLKFAVFV
jgi:four helix bundle protein